MARKARRQLLFLTPLVVGTVIFYEYRVELLGLDTPMRVVVGGVLVILGWIMALDLGRALRPLLDRHLDPAKAELVSFLIRFFTLVVAILVALRFAGFSQKTIAVGASLTGIILGLAAQQTLGNLIAGMVLLSARPFEVGDRVRFVGFGMDVEGTVVSRGLLYVTCTDGDDLVLVPNTTALTMSVRPIRQPASVNMIARLPLGVDPEAVQKSVTAAVTLATKNDPHVTLEEFNQSEVVVRIPAPPVNFREGAKLARQILQAVATFSEVPAPAVQG